MADKKLEEVSNFLKDKISFTFFLVFFSLFLISWERTIENFDKNLLEKKKELEEFNEKSNIRKEEILKSQNENN